VAQIGEEVEEVEVWPLEAPDEREFELPLPEEMPAPVETPARA
jgi:hypothetical protein